MNHIPNVTNVGIYSVVWLCTVYTSWNVMSVLFYTQLSMSLHRNKTGIHYHLIRFKFTSKYFIQSYSYFGLMFKVEYIVYLWIYINISCNCKNNPANRLTTWSAIYKINTKGESLMMKSSADIVVVLLDSLVLIGWTSNTLSFMVYCIGLILLSYS